MTLKSIKNAIIKPFLKPVRFLMKKKKIFGILVFLRVVLAVLLFVYSTEFLFSENGTYTIEGEVLYAKKGKIYLYLVDKEGFKTPLTGLQTIVLNTDQSDNRNGRISFRFMNVRPGTYGIRCFQDTNGNRKMDRGLFGPAEPWGMSWNTKKPSGWPRFEKIAFPVNSDLKPIIIKLSNS